MPKKQNTVRSPIIANSMSETIINFLDMFNRTNAYGNPTSKELFDLAPTKFKKIDNLHRALERLCKMGFVSFYSDKKEKRYVITQSGLEVPYVLALARRKKRTSSKYRNSRDSDDD